MIVKVLVLHGISIFQKETPNKKYNFVVAVLYSEKKTCFLFGFHYFKNVKIYGRGINSYQGLKCVELFRCIFQYCSKVCQEKYGRFIYKQCGSRQTFAIAIKKFRRKRVDWLRKGEEFLSLSGKIESCWEMWSLHSWNFFFCQTKGKKKIDLQEAQNPLGNYFNN